MSFKDRFRSNQLPFWLLTIGFGMVLILPKLIMDGMFMDGVLYASVSHNLSIGIGTPWFLEFNEYGITDRVTFHEHPPLIFWIQSLFFKVFGGSMYVERGYSLLTGIITAALIVKTWKLVTIQNINLQKLSWMPVLLWLTVPVVFWSYQNNVHENTMGIFTILAVFFSIKAVHLKQKLYLNIVIAGAMIFCASFGKGVPGLFPLGVVFFHWIIFRKQSFGKMFLQSLLLLAIPAAIYGLLLLIPAAQESLSIYTYERLLGRIKAAPTRDYHFYIAERLFMEILPMIIVTFLTLLVFRLGKVKHQLTKEHYKLSAFFVLMGLSASLPVMLTLVQKTFYIGPAFPFFGLAFALIIAPGLADRLARINRSKIGFKVFTTISSLIIVAAIVATVFQYGKPSRNKKVLHDLEIIQEIIPHFSTINVHASTGNLEWDMQCYLVRFYNISMDKNPDHHRKYFLMNRELGVQPDSNYVNLNLPTQKYDLYEWPED